MTAAHYCMHRLQVSPTKAATPQHCQRHAMRIKPSGLIYRTSLLLAGVRKQLVLLEEEQVAQAHGRNDNRAKCELARARTHGRQPSPR